MAKHKLVCLELFHPTYFPRIRGDPPCKDVHVYHVQHHTLLVHHQKKKHARTKTWLQDWQMLKKSGFEKKRNGPKT